MCTDPALCIFKASRSCELVNAKLLSARSRNCGPNGEPQESDADPESRLGSLFPWLDVQLDIVSHPESREMFVYIKCLTPEACLGGRDPPGESLVLV